VVRGTFSPARAWRPAVVARLARTLGRTCDWQQKWCRNREKPKLGFCFGSRVFFAVGHSRAPRNFAVPQRYVGFCSSRGTALRRGSRSMRPNHSLKVSPNGVAHWAAARGLRPILRRVPSAPHRRAHLSSNVRQHRNRPCCYPIGSAPDGVGLRRNPSRVLIAGRYSVWQSNQVFSRKHQRRKSPEAPRVKSWRCCAPRQQSRTLNSSSVSGSWCRRRREIGTLVGQRSGGDDCTHRVELRPYLASQQQKTYCRSSHVPQRCRCACAVRPNHSLKVSPNGVAHWPCGAGPSAHFAPHAQRATPLGPP
jgi:hypothetical protein